MNVLITATRALLAHAEEHDLPAPSSIETMEGHLWVHVGGDRDPAAWLASVQRDTASQEMRTPEIGPAYYRSEVTGRLPATGVRVRVTATSPEPVLTAVTR